MNPSVASVCGPQGGRFIPTSTGRSLTTRHLLCRDVCWFGEDKQLVQLQDIRTVISALTSATLTDKNRDETLMKKKTSSLNVLCLFIYRENWKNSYVKTKLLFNFFCADFMCSCYVEVSLLLKHKAWSQLEKEFCPFFYYYYSFPRENFCLSLKAYLLSDFSTFKLT